ncbi:MAG: hypothetical protein MJ077_00005 [Oscillospiraceae bacterium]|nr:hypothetical protein [Oscillospiraceae bacterium]
MMSCTSFLKGMGMGLAIGTTVGSMMPSKRCMRRKHTAAKAVRAVTNVMDELADALS